MFGEDVLRIVIVGHVDHGKSTLIGRLLYDTGCLSKDRMRQIEESSKRLGKKADFAFATDCLEEERAGGLTIDAGYTYFKSSKRRYVIIDAPGHREFLKNMITGSSYAEAALVVIDAHEGVKEQTKRHCYILRLIGLGQVCVLINKMDLAGYQEEIFVKTKKEMATFMDKLGFSAACFIPVSAKEGDNIAASSKAMSWYSGPTALEALDTFREIDIKGKPFRFPVQDVYERQGREIVVGRVESGRVSSGDTLTLSPEKRRLRVMRIERFPSSDNQAAEYGECIGICFTEKSSARRGQVISGDPGPATTRTIQGNIFWMDTETHQVGEGLVFRCVTQEAACRIGRIMQKFDPASMDFVEKDAKELRGGEVANAEIILDRDVVTDTFNFIPEMGRFVLESGGNPAGGGVIT